MKFVLPQPRTTPLKVNPKKLLILSVGKMGKTTILSKLDNCLLLDLEGGSDYATSGHIIDVKKEAALNGVSMIEMLSIISDTIKEAGNPYKYIAIDPITSLEDIVNPLACSLYRKTVMGKAWKGTDILTLPNGAGYKYQRDAFKKAYQSFEQLTEHLILIGHIKDKFVNKKGEETTIKDIDLAGKLGRIVGQDMSAIGILYKKGDERIISFKKDDVDIDTIFESRTPHLSDTEIVISRKQKDGTIETYWESIFIK